MAGLQERQKPTDDTVELLKDILITQLGLAGDVRAEAGSDSAGERRGVSHLRANLLNGNGRGRGRVSVLPEIGRQLKDAGSLRFRPWESAPAG